MSQPLRIAVFTGAFPVLSETFIVRQIAALIEAGHEVDIYADCRSPDATVQPEVARDQLLDRTTWMDMPPESAPWEMPAWPPTARTWPPGAERSVHNSVRLARALPAFTTAFVRQPRLAIDVLKPSEYGYQATSLSALYRLRKLSRVRKRYDVLHAHFGPVAKSFRFARQLWRAPLLASFHGYDFSTVPRKEGRGVYDKLFGTVDAVIANSDYTRAQLEKLGCASKRIRKLPVGLNVDEFSFSERRRQPGEPIRVITVARLVEIKGYEYVIRAIAKVRATALPVHYDIVGEGPLRAKLQRIAGDLELGDTVAFHGARTSVEVRSLMQQAHIFVLTSVSIEGDQEGQGLVVQEAQASGLPVIVTRDGALPEGMLDGKSGFVVPERDIDAIAERILHLSAHPEMWPQMGRLGREFVEQNYDVRKLNCALIKIYHDAVEEFKAAHR